VAAVAPGRARGAEQQRSLRAQRASRSAAASARGSHDVRRTRGGDRSSLLAIHSSEPAWRSVALGALQRLGESVSERADVGRRLDRSPAEQRRVHVAPAAGGFGHQTAKSAVKHSLRQPILDRHATSKAASRRKRGSSGTTLQWRELDNNIRELHEGVTRKNKTAKCEIRCSSFCARARASFSSPLQSTPPPGSSTTASRRRRSPGRGRQTIQPFSSQCDQRYSSASDWEAEVCVHVSLRCLIRTGLGTETEGCHASEGESDERPTG